MRKLFVIAFACALATSLAFAQGTYPSDLAKPDTAKAENASTKAASLSGKLSDDGKTFTDKDGKSWTVSNPEALKGHEGHEVTLKAHLDADKKEVHVVSVRMGKDEMKETQQKDEMKK